MFRQSLFLACSLLCNAAEGAVLINEFLANPVSGAPEWVELYNTDSVASVDLSGFSVSDNRGVKYAKSVGEYDIAPHGVFYLVVSNSDRYLNNGKDGVFLRNKDEEVIDSFSYTTKPPEGLSNFRWPDGGAWQAELQPPSPDESNNGTLKPIVINEILANPDDTVGEWVELYNLHPSVAVSLRGYSVRDAGGGVRALPEDAVIQSNDFYVFTVSSSDRYLNNNGDTVNLFFTDNMVTNYLVDSYSFLGASGDTSFFRHVQLLNTSFTPHSRIEHL
eukprot:gene649-1081_t